MIFIWKFNHLICIKKMEILIFFKSHSLYNQEETQGQTKANIYIYIKRKHINLKLIYNKTYLWHYMWHDINFIKSAFYQKHF